MSDIEAVLYQCSIDDPNLYQRITDLLLANKIITLEITLYSNGSKKYYLHEDKRGTKWSKNKFEIESRWNEYIFKYQLASNKIKQVDSRDILSNFNQELYKELFIKEWIYQAVKSGIRPSQYYLNKIMMDIWTIEEFKCLQSSIDEIISKIRDNLEYKQRTYILDNGNDIHRWEYDILINTAKTYYTKYGDFLDRYLYLARMQYAIYLIDYDSTCDLSTYLCQQDNYWMIKPNYIVDIGKDKRNYEFDYFYTAYCVDNTKQTDNDNSSYYFTNNDEKVSDYIKLVFKNKSNVLTWVENANTNSSSSSSDGDDSSSSSDDEEENNIKLEWVKSKGKQEMMENTKSEWTKCYIEDNDTTKIITKLKNCGYYNLPIIKFEGFPLIITNELFRSQAEALNHLKKIVDTHYFTPITSLNIEESVLHFKYRPNSNLREITDHSKQIFNLQFYDYSA